MCCPPRHDTAVLFDDTELLLRCVVVCRCYSLVLPAAPCWAVPAKALPYVLQVNDTIRLDIETGKPIEFIKFELGNLAMATGGANNG